MNATARASEAALALLLGAGAVLADDGDSYASRSAGTSPHSFEFGLYDTHRESGEDALTAGLAYHYRVAPAFDVGARAEYAGGALDSWVVGVPLTAHFGEGWQLLAMPGAEFDGGDVSGLFRLGFGYVLEFSGFGLKPEFNADFVDGEVNYVLGASVVFGF